MTRPPPHEIQLGGLHILSYLSELVMHARDGIVWNKVDMLAILNTIKNDPELFDPQEVAQWDADESHFDAEAQR